MNVIETPRFILSGNKTAAGKSITAIGLAVALRKRNVSISSAINASDPIQATILRRLTRRYCRSLDANILNNSQILTSLQQSALGADLMMIEGQSGLFDGLSPGSLKTSDAELAALTRTPVILVVDAKGYGNSLAALIKGFSEFAQGFTLAGVIANNCQFDPNQDDEHGGSALTRDKIFFDSVLQGFGMSPLLGAVPETNLDFPTLRDKFTQLRGSVSMPLQFFKDVGNLIENFLDVDELIRLAGNAPTLRLPDKVFEPEVRRTRIAVSEDTCFSIGYQDNIDLLRFYGAEVVPFSPLADEELPKRIGGLYMTGGMIAAYAEELSKNQSMRSSIRSFIDSGGVVFSEGAGSAYLADQFESDEDGVFVDGIGALSGRAVKDLSYFLYNESITIEDSILGRAGGFVKGVSIGEWRLESGKPMNKMLRISAGSTNSVDEGYTPAAQMICTFSFPHFGSNPAMAKNIVDAAEIVARV